MRTGLILPVVLALGGSLVVSAPLVHAQEAPRYSSYFGGPGFDQAAVVAVGRERSSDAGVYTAVGEESPVGSGKRDVRIIKLAPITRAIVYSVVLGGSEDDFPMAISVAPDGSVWVIGFTQSSDFTVVNPIQPAASAPIQSAFLARLDPTGSLTFSTMFASSTVAFSSGQSVVADGNGSAVFSGVTCGSTLPATAGVFQPSNAGGCDGFIARVSSAGTLVSATYLGGSRDEGVAAIAIGSDGDVFVGGDTSSSDLPTSAGAFQTGPSSNGCPPANNGFALICTDGYVGRFSADLSTRRYLTYLRDTGASNSVSDMSDAVTAIAVGPQGDAYVTGATASGNLFPTTPGAYRTTCLVCGPVGGRVGNIAGDVFVARVNSTGSSLVYSTFLGGASPAASAGQFGRAIAVDFTGRAYVAGETTAADFPVVDGVQAALNGPSDAFLARLSAQGTALEYSTFFGGNGSESTRSLALEGGIAWIGGQTDSSDLRVSPSALQPAPGGSTDGFFFAIQKSESLLSIDSPPEGAVTLPFQVAGWAMDRGVGFFGSGIDFLHVYAFPSPGSGAPPIFLGSSFPSFARGDIAALFGDRFQFTGWAVRVDSLPAGPYLVVVFAHSIVTNTYTVIGTRAINVDSRPLLSVDAPAPGSVLPAGSRVFVGGWAIDLGAVSGTGIDAVHVWIYPGGGAGTPFFAGVATYGVSRADVGGIFGSKFTPSGYQLDVDGLAPGSYVIAVFAHSTVTNGFAIVQTRSVTIQ